MKLSSYQRKDQYLFNIIAGFVISVIVAGCSTYYIAQHLDYFVLRLMLTAIPIAILLVCILSVQPPKTIYYATILSLTASFLSILINF
jgi:hypothetical protein|tara:strand:- start:1405 stop:1668 length:264 start_codon:yes stop_codon:yes gene_type:complete